MMVIVPNVLRDEINKKLDDAFLVVPEAEKDRDIFFHHLLSYFYENGVIPDFELTKKGGKRC